MNLTLERQKCGLTRKELAALSAVTEGVITDIEEGRTKGAPSTLKRLRAALDGATDLGGEPMAMFAPPPVLAPAVNAVQAGEQVRRMRLAESLTEAALARLIGGGCAAAAVNALEAGESTVWLDEALMALEQFRDMVKPRALAEGHCGFCGGVHRFGQCPR